MESGNPSEVFPVGFNPTLIRDAIGCLMGGGREQLLRLQFYGRSAALVMTLEDHPGHLSLVMPLRLLRLENEASGVVETPVL
jgi:hypothetical protein